MQQAGTLCDLELIAGDSELTVNTHRTVLAASSKYFYMKLHESDFNYMEPLVISELDSKCLSVAIAFVYGVMPISAEDMLLLKKSNEVLKLSNFDEAYEEFIKNYTVDDCVKIASEQVSFRPGVNTDESSSDDGMPVVVRVRETDGYSSWDESEVDQQSRKLSTGPIPRIKKRDNRNQMEKDKGKNNNRHKKVKQKFTEHACPYCGDQVLLEDLRDHLVSNHLQEVPIICPVCGDSPDHCNQQTRNEMAAHIIRHVLSEVPKSYLRYICERCSSYSCTKVNHIRHVNCCGPPDREQVCTFCHGEVSTKMELLLHISSEHLSKKFLACGVCCYMHTRPTSIARHFENSHSVKFMFAHLMLIKAVITNENCQDYLDQILKHSNGEYSDTLDIFIRRHFCSLCDQMFKKQSDLIEHLRSHAGPGDAQPPLTPRDAILPIHTCHLCSFKATTVKAVGVHIAAKHPDEKLRQLQTCPVCDTRCFGQDGLDTHMRAHVLETL